MHGDVAAVGLGVRRVDGANVLHARGQKLPGIVALLPPRVRREGVSHGLANRGEVLVDPPAAIVERDLRGSSIEPRPCRCRRDWRPGF